MHLGVMKITGFISLYFGYMLVNFLTHKIADFMANKLRYRGEGVFFIVETYPSSYQTNTPAGKRPQWRKRLKAKAFKKIPGLHGMAHSEMIMNEKVFIGFLLGSTEKDPSLSPE